MLRDSDLREEFEQLTRGVRLDDGLRLRRWGWSVAAGGVAVQIAGVVALAYGRDPGSPGGRVGLLGGAHVGHALLALGLGVSVLGAALAVGGPVVFGGLGRTRRRVLGGLAAVVSLALVTAGVVAFQRSVLDGAPSTVSTPSSAGAPPTASATPVNPDVAAAAAIPDQPLDAATRAQLADQLTIARQTALQYPTVADALKAHMYLAGGFAPGSGAHYMWMAGVVQGIKPNGQVDPRYPASFIYDGTSPTSRIVGLMYISLKPNAPEGFAGPNDHWHRHFNVCVVYGSGAIQVPFPADADVTRAQCDSVHGEFMQQTVWMIHTWVVPGWESPQGVFSHANPDLRCADGTFDTDARGFCKGT